LNANFGDVRGLVPSLLSDPDVTDVAVADTGIPLHSGRVAFGGEAITDVKGSILPTVLDGRLPERPNEILLGSQTMASLHTAIGRSIPVAITGITTPVPMKVVGKGVLSPVGDTETLGKGAVVGPGARDTFMASAPPGFQAPGPGDAFVRFRSGIPRPQAIAALSSRLGGIEKVIVTAPNQPTDIADFGQVQSLPQTLAALLAALAAATMAYLLITAIRRRRRELAILKTVGFVPAQISVAVAWQATTVAAVAMLVGIPLGVVAGRAVWSAIAHQIGVVVETQVPWRWIALVVPSTIIVANLLAAVPAAAAGRISATRALRGE
jgi:ABC-type antimicrobial peptide transport system permease subunit